MKSTLSAPDRSKFLTRSDENAYSARMIDELTIRRARAEDVAAVVTMLADDPLGQQRESPGDPAYDVAFAEIDADPNQVLVVAEHEREVVGTLQLTFIPGLSRRGAARAQIEAVRVRSAERGRGTGRRMVRWAIETARDRGATLVQLTSHLTRERAHEFYERLGFARSHVGMKLDLD